MLTARSSILYVISMAHMASTATREAASLEKRKTGDQPLPLHRSWATRRKNSKYNAAQAAKPNNNASAPIR